MAFQDSINDDIRGIARTIITSNFTIAILSVATIILWNPCISWSFCPPLQNISVWKTDTDGETNVHFSVYDPVLQTMMEDCVTGFPHSPQIYQDKGIVAFKKPASFPGGENIHVAVYSPVRKKWIKDILPGFRELFNTFDSVGTVTIADGVVAATGVKDDVFGYIEEWGVSYATYDPFKGKWQMAFEGDLESYPVLVNKEGIVAWHVWLSATGNQYDYPKFYYTLYDPVKGKWTSLLYGGTFTQDIDNCLSVKIEIENATITILSDDAYTRGFRKDTRRWYAGETTPEAIFHTSPVTGPPHLNVWLTNMSIGAGGFLWEFGDGEDEDEVCSPLHTYTTHGQYRAVLAITSPNGEDMTDSLIEVEDIHSYFLDITTASPEGVVEVSPNDGTFLYPAGTEVSLKAVPTDGRQFSYWLGEVDDPKTSETTVVMHKDQKVKAIFESKTLRLAEGLVAEYRFNGNAYDTSGNGNHAEMHGPVPATGRLGEPDGSYWFDGMDDYIRADASSFPESQRTVSLWFHAESVANQPVLLGYGGNSCGTSFFMGVNVNRAASFHMSSHCLVNQINYFYEEEPIGRWVHFALTTNPNGTFLFVDGEMKALNENFITNTVAGGTDLAIGVDVDARGTAPYTDMNVGYFRGRIDDVRIYNRALTSLEIADLAKHDQSIVNVDARRNIHFNPNRIYFKAGTYTITPVGTSEQGFYNAWNPWGHGPYWTHRYWVDSDFFDQISTMTDWYETDTEALDHAVVTSFSLPQDAYVDFFIADSVYTDNTGGVSLKVTMDSISLCEGDLDVDGDLDGTDLFELVVDMNRVGLEAFAEKFGSQECLADIK